MTIQDILNTIATLTTLSLSILITFAAVYWVYAQRRIRYLEGRLWLRQVSKEAER